MPTIFGFAVSELVDMCLGCSLRMLPEIMLLHMQFPHLWKTEIEKEWARFV